MQCVQIKDIRWYLSTGTYSVHSWYTCWWPLLVTRCSGEWWGVLMICGHMVVCDKKATGGHMTWQPLVTHRLWGCMFRSVMLWVGYTWCALVTWSVLAA